MGLIAYFLSYRAIFFVAAALVVPLLLALGRIQPSDIHFGRASCIPDHQGPSAPPRARLGSLWKTRALLIFGGCVFLFQMANASMLPLAGEAFAYGKEAFSSLIVSVAGHYCSSDSRHCRSVRWCLPGPPIQCFSSPLKCWTESAERCWAYLRR
jgi:hypothetical protein